MIIKILNNRKRFVQLQFSVGHDVFRVNCLFFTFVQLFPINTCAAKLINQSMINPDLVEERNVASFSTIEMSEFLFGGKEGVQRRSYIRSLIEKNRVFLKVKKFRLANSNVVNFGQDDLVFLSR